MNTVNHAQQQQELAETSIVNGSMMLATIVSTLHAGGALMVL